MPEKVLITGATGFIAGHTVAQLLDAGYELAGTVRDPGDEAKLAHLRVLPGAGERLTLLQADLNTPGAFAPYVNDVDYVLHMASPYALNVKDPQKDLVDPAVNGTLSVLEACAKSARIRRVVLTSSMAAITDEPDGSRTLTEADWNEKSTLTRNPYYFSKVRAERAAWDFVAKNQPSWDLVAINPFLVIGPSLTRSINESNKVFADLINGKFPAIMDLNWGLVDVRDVAAAHLKAMTANNASGRYLCAAEVRSMRAAVDLIRKSGFAQTKLPKLGMDTPFGTKLALLASYLQPRGVATYLRTHLGRTPNFDNSKIRRELGVEFRDVDASIVEACRDLVLWGHVPPGRESNNP